MVANFILAVSKGIKTNHIYLMRNLQIILLSRETILRVNVSKVVFGQREKDLWGFIPNSWFGQLAVGTGEMYCSLTFFLHGWPWEPIILISLATPQPHWLLNNLNYVRSWPEICVFIRFPLFLNRCCFSFCQFFSPCLRKWWCFHGPCLFGNRKNETKGTKSGSLRDHLEAITQHAQTSGSAMDYWITTLTRIWFLINIVYPCLELAMIPAELYHWTY